MKTLTAMLVGCVVGVVATLLYAPRSGEETRAQISGKAMDLRNHTSETVMSVVSQARSKADELKENAQYKAAELKENAEDKAAELRNQ